jgi:hypothetical protein
LNDCENGPSLNLDMATIALTDDRTTEPDSGLRPGPLFVVGMWRSGTSLLYALLNQHSQIALMYEAELPVLRPLFLMRRGKADWAERWNFWNSALERHQISADQIPQSVNDLPSAVRDVYGHYALRKGASIWGGKSPNYYDFLTRLASEFPQAQFIVIWRDPADICRSILRAAGKDTWFSKRGVPHRALFGLHRMKQECDRLVSRGVSLHQINYEDLIHQTPEVMQGICEFLGIPFEASMTSLEGADRSAVYEGEHHQGVKSEKIVGKKLRPEVLPPTLKRKIQRYTKFWRKEYGNAWPTAPSDLLEEQVQMPGVLERVKDEFLFRAYRALDAAVVLVYCFAPIALLRKYRAVKAQTFDTPAETRQSPRVPADR